MFNHRFALLVLSYLVLLPAAVGRGEQAVWSEPAIDSWFYVNGINAGERIFAPSFSGVDVDQEAEQFFPNDQQGPARLGSMMLAFETADHIQPGLEPSQYRISSVTVTARSPDGSTGSLLHSDQPITPAGFLADALGSGITEQQPMELFGVGFRDGYEGFDLGIQTEGTLFEESTSPYSASDGGYVAFPVIGDGSGGFQDVSNNITGGFSATAPAGETAPFTATPWAIGTADLNQGQVVPLDTTFQFAVDLDQPGVEDYLKKSLATGAVGFFLSSMHPAAQEGVGGVPYPQWYTKEAVDSGFFPEAEPATLTIEFEILEDMMPGDYDRNRKVDHNDYMHWRSSVGNTVSTPGDGADGNKDGHVGSADYLIWLNHLGMAETSNVSSGSSPVPEPYSVVIMLLAVASIGCRRSVSFSGSQSRCQERG